MKFCSDVIMWTALTVALPYTTLALPVPYSAPSAPDSDEHLLRTAAFSSSSSLSSSSSSSVVDSVKPSFSLASSTVSSSSFSNGRAVIMLASSGTSFSREKRERTGRVPRSLEQTNSEILQKAGADPQVPGSANPLATSVPPPILRHHRKNQAPKKRPSSKKRRRRRKCPKKDQKQRRRKHRKCSRKSKRNGRKKKKKKNRNKNRRKGKKRGKKKRRRRVTEGGSKNVTSDKREVVTAQDVVNAPKATPSSVLPSQVASLFDSASPLKPVEQKDPKEKPSRPLAELASAYDSSRPLLSANHFKNLQHNRHSHQTPPSKSKHERVRRSIAVLLRRLSSENDGYGDETNLLDERTRVFETLSSLLRQKSNVQRTSLPQILNEQYFGKL